MLTVEKARVLQRLNRTDGAWLEKRAAVLEAVHPVEKQASLMQSVADKVMSREFTPEHQKLLDALLDAHGISKHPATVARFEDMLKGAKEEANSATEKGTKEWLLRHRGKLGLGVVGIGGLALAGHAMGRAQQDPEDAEHSDIASMPANAGGF